MYEVLLKYKFKLEHKLNIDEIDILTVLTPVKIIGPKGVKQLEKAVSWERGRNIFVVCTNRTSVYSTYVYFQRERMLEQLTKYGLVGTIYRYSKKGWINENLFLNQLKPFGN